MPEVGRASVLWGGLDMRLLLSVFATALITAGSPSVPTPALAGVVEHVARPSVRATAPGDVLEGDRYWVTIRTPRVRLKHVVLEKQTTNIFGEKQWEQVRRFGDPPRKVSYKAVAGAADVDRYRVRAVTVKGVALGARRVSVRVWHWFDLGDFEPYYRTGCVRDEGFWQFGLNGNQYHGWHGDCTYDMWESRYTPGRNCVAFRGVFGVTDESSDGSSARIAVLADDLPVYESPMLTPGMDESKTIALSRPYRLSIQGWDTSTDGQASHPAIGDAQLLCRGF